jgi:hypothetical protein
MWVIDQDYWKARLKNTKINNYDDGADGKPEKSTCQG